MIPWGNSSRLIELVHTVSGRFPLHRGALRAALSTGFNSGLPAPTTWSFSFFRSGQLSNGIAWFSLTAGEYSNKTPDYFGIDFTLPTMTGNNRRPIVKERWYYSKRTVSQKSGNGTPYISALKDGVLRRLPDNRRGLTCKYCTDRCKNCRCRRFRSRQGFLRDDQVPYVCAASISRGVTTRAPISLISQELPSIGHGNC